MLSKGKKQAGLISAISEYINNKPYIISLSVCVIAAYLFFVTHYSISIDDLARDRYVLDGYIAVQGRFTGMILSVLLDFFGLHTGVLEFLGILFLALSAIVFCSAFDCIYTTVNKVPQILFSCFFVTFPLHAESFIYSGCALSIGLGTFLAAFALRIILQEANEKRFSGKTVKNLAVAALLLTVPASWYESVLFVYYSAVFALLILKLFSYRERNEFTIKDFFVFGLYFAIPLVAAIFAEYLFQTAVLNVWDTDINNFAMNKVEFGRIFSLSGIVSLVGTCYKRWVLPIFYYFPITVFAGAIIAGAALFLVIACKRKNIKFLLAFLGLLSGTALNSFLLMQGAPYRMSQAVPFFVAFMAFVSVMSLSAGKRRFSSGAAKLVSILLIIICLNQITEINYWFNLEDVKYQNEKQAVEQIAYELNSEFNTEKPVVFVGAYKFDGKLQNSIQLQEDSFGYKAIAFTKETLYRLCEKLEGMGSLTGTKTATAIRSFLARDEGNTVYIIPQSLCKSYITWGIAAFREVNTELLKFFSYLGYDFKQGTREMYDEALTVAEDLPAWPKNGSIIDNGDYILVNFGIGE